MWSTIATYSADIIVLSASQAKMLQSIVHVYVWQRFPKLKICHGHFENIAVTSHRYRSGLYTDGRRKWLLFAEISSHGKIILKPIANLATGWGTTVIMCYAYSITLTIIITHIAKFLERYFSVFVLISVEYSLVHDLLQLLVGEVVTNHRL